MHVCIMQVGKINISMILDPDACIYDAVLFGNGPTDQRTDKAILGVGCTDLEKRML